MTSSVARSECEWISLKATLIVGSHVAGQQNPRQVGRLDANVRRSTIRCRGAHRRSCVCCAVDKTLRAAYAIAEDWKHRARKRFSKCSGMRTPDILDARNRVGTTGPASAYPVAPARFECHRLALELSTLVRARFVLTPEAPTQCHATNRGKRAQFSRRAGQENLPSSACPEFKLILRPSALRQNDLTTTICRSHDHNFSTLFTRPPVNNQGGVTSRE